MAHQQKWLSGRVNGYTSGTLENNWNEERFDIKYLKESKPIPSQFNHFYTTTYTDLCSNKSNIGNATDSAVTAARHRTPGFPGHQPELDMDSQKKRLNTYETDHRVNYLDPRLKKFSFDLNQMISNEINAKGGEHQQQVTVEIQNSSTTSAPIVQLEKVFADDPISRVFKATLNSKVIPVIETVKPQPTTTITVSPVVSQASICEEEREDLSNFDKLMIQINRKKSGRAEPTEQQKKSVHWEDQ